MKQLLKTLAVAALGVMPVTLALAHERLPSFSRFSDSHQVAGTVLESYAVYGSSYSSTRRVCEDVRVPIYANNPNATGDVVAGIVVGGILGKAITGNNNGATTGAVLGGIAAAQNSRKVTGYRIERQCNDVEVVNDNVQYYETRVRLEGRIYRVRTDRPFQPGSTLYMWVHN